MDQKRSNGTMEHVTVCYKPRKCHVRRSVIPTFVYLSLSTITYNSSSYTPTAASSLNVSSPERSESHQLNVIVQFHKWVIQMNQV